MKAKLAEWMVCPVSERPLALEVARESEGEVLEGTLRSSERSYPITGGVPRLVPGDATDPGQRETADAFSEKWRSASPSFGHEEKSRDFYLRWYLERYEFDGLEGLGRLLRTKTRVLDAGTGLGRDTSVYADHTAGEVFGVDISGSVERVYERLGRRPNVHVVQADLTRLPFPRGFFDFIACDQVLHHTRDTRESFHSLVSRLAPGGDLLVYVYKKKAPLREYSDDYLRSAMHGRPEAEVWALSEQLTKLGRALSDLQATVEVPDIPVLGIQAGRYDVQRFIYWHVLKCYWNAGLDWHDSVITNFDWYRPLYAHRHTPDEVRSWCAEAGLEIVTLHVCEAGISVRARRP